MDLAATIKNIIQNMANIEEEVTLIHLEVINKTKEDGIKIKDALDIENEAIQKILELDLVILPKIRELRGIIDSLKINCIIVHNS